ncbi:MAG: two pore domain potassium channel family protein [Bdellovibrionales bacterium]|nr:two pore domain potassium channel family protein [Bdellovibrionales bacterium]
MRVKINIETLNSPAFFGFLYLLLIPIFACIFSYLPKYSFHHTTIQFEKSVFDARNTARDATLAAIQSSLSERLDGKILEVDGFTMNPKELYLQDFDCEGSSCKFMLIANFRRSPQYHIPLALEVDMFTPPITPETRFEEFNPGGSNLRQVSVIPWPQNSLLQIAERAPKVNLQILLNEKTDPQLGTVFEIDNKIEYKIRDYKYAKAGFPSEIQNSFLRMLYFSASNVTLGLGDILPITDLSRFLVLTETISGMILIGLFFNSLTTKKD